MQVMWEKRTRGDNGDQITTTGPPRQKLRILVVDDHRDCAVTLGLLCRLWGHETQFCFDGASALQSLADFQPDVFLLDIAMPRMDGYELAQKLRNLPPYRDALLIAVSGFADASHRARGLGFGFDDYLAKPTDARQLQNLFHARQSLLLDRARLVA